LFDYNGFTILSNKNAIRGTLDPQLQPAAHLKSKGCVELAQAAAGGVAHPANRY
jgi:hypothetical protein